MDEQFKGEFISYNIIKFKKQLNNKGIYLDSYEIDDAIKMLNMIDKYDLDILEIYPELVESKNKMVIHNSCTTVAEKESLEAVLEIGRIIKRNLLLANYNFKPSQQVPSSLQETFEYIRGNIILIMYPIKEDKSDFKSFYIYDMMLPKPIIFVNTNQPLNKQIYYLMCELNYHFNSEYSCNTKFNFSNDITFDTYVSSFAREVIWDNYKNWKIDMQTFIEDFNEIHGPFAHQLS